MISLYFIRLEVSSMAVNSEINSCLQIVPIFQGLDDSDLEQIDAIVKEHYFAKGEQLFKPGDAADELIIMHQGQVKLSSYGSDGQEKIVALLQSGDFDGTATLFKPQKRMTYAMAVTDGKACVLKRRPFQNIMRQSPELAVKLLNEVGNQLIDQQSGYIRNQTTDARGRIASYLLEYSYQIKENTFKLPFKKYELANLLDITPETLSRQLKILEEDGYIKKLPHSKIEIVKPEELSFLI